MSEWKPIETAKKDGTKIDLWIVRNGKGERLADCRWHEREYRDEPEEGYNIGYWEQAYSEHPSSFHPVNHEPTHWMPLPDPPVAGIVITGAAFEDSPITVPTDVHTRFTQR